MNFILHFQRRDVWRTFTWHTQLLDQSPRSFYWRPLASDTQYRGQIEPALSRGCRWGRYHKKNIASVQIGCLVEQASNAVLQKSELKVLDPISKTEKMLDCTNAWDINLDVSLFSVTTRKATPQSNFNGDSVFNFYAYNLKFVLNFQNYNFDPNFAFSWIY